MFLAPSVADNAQVLRDIGMPGLHPPTTPPVVEEAAGVAAFRADLLRGLAATPRSVSPKYFYDAAGSALFERICELPEYYPTRVELGILRRHAADMAACIGPDAEIIEFGAGASVKIRVLLDALAQPRRFVPIDISGEHLHDAAAQLGQDYPWLDIAPIAADFTDAAFHARLGMHIDAAGSGEEARGRRVGFFPGSSIGNFDPAEARNFLTLARRSLRGGGLLIGYDLVKDPAVLHAAYNDAAGVTAAFNRNLLVRANSELDADFQPQCFDHYAFYNPVRQRVEMHLVSSVPQLVRIGGECGGDVEFAEGDSIHTENSHKFTVESFSALAQAAGFIPGPVWHDPSRWFCVQWLRAPE
ncbi:L-histidine N(alpha)-methyltransferase [Uliginosibacterium sp. H1]|uniref:L-histidine N(alpha)-methyltransferase n=1 Tax=Uliginosibacterium sp. H1 TaxID=3114757 RepID=UPI002E194A40|nr:L-histidine N(alpha)-methyltransferase [Uliginosibacterium sp. H1]